MPAAAAGKPAWTPPSRTGSRPTHRNDGRHVPPRYDSQGGRPGNHAGSNGDANAGARYCVLPRRSDFGMALECLGQTARPRIAMDLAIQGPLPTRSPTPSPAVAGRSICGMPPGNRVRPAANPQILHDEIISLNRHALSRISSQIGEIDEEVRPRRRGARNDRKALPRPTPCCKKPLHRIDGIYAGLS